MRTLLMAGAASLAVLALPAALPAQDTAPTADAHTGAHAGMTAEQRARYEAWPLERRTTFDSLDREEQDYFWTLTPERQDIWWTLTRDERAQIRGMDPENHARAWASIEQQAAVAAAAEGEAGVLARTNGATTGAQAGMTSGAGADVRGLRFESNEVVQRVAEAPSEYPICRGDIDDRCINAWEAGQRGPGVNRPLDHWPGRPASES